MAERTLSIRLSLKDADQVRAALEGLGRDGERALGRLNSALAQAQSGPSAGLRAISASSRDLQAAATGLAARLPVASAALGAIGPAGAAAALGVGLAAAAAHKAVEAAEDYGRAFARVEAVNRATGFGAGLTAEQIGDLAQEIQDSTMASDRAALEAAAALATFGAVSGEQFRQTLRLAQDLAAVMGGDLRSAAATLGKALADPAEGMTMLRRAGIVFTQAQRDAIKAMAETGDRAGAVAAILDQVAARVGGAGAGERRGVSGAVKGLADAWDDLLKEIGRTAFFVQPALAALELLAKGVRALQPETPEQRHTRLVAALGAGQPADALVAGYAKAYGVDPTAGVREELVQAEDALQNRRRREQLAAARGAAAEAERANEALDDQAKAMAGIVSKYQDELRLARLVADERKIAAARAKAEAEVLQAVKVGNKYAAPANVRAEAEKAGDLAAQAEREEQATRAKQESKKAEIELLVAAGERIEQDRARRKETEEGTRAENDRARSVIEVNRAIADQVRALQGEAALAGLDERDRAIEIELLKAEAAARRDLTRGIVEQDRTLTDAERRRVAAAAGAKYDAEDRAGKEKAAARERERAAEHTVERIVDLSADGFARLAAHGKDAFSDIGDFALSTMRSTFAQIASEQLVKPIAQQLVGMFQQFASGIPGGGFLAGGLALGGLALTSLFGGKKDTGRAAEKQRQAQAATEAAQTALAQAAASAAEAAQAQARAAAEMDLAARRSLADLRGDTAASFQLLIEDNARRLDEARKAGANLALIEAENAALRRRHLAGLTDAEFRALGQATTALERFDRAVQSLTRGLDDEISRRVRAAGDEARAAADAARDYGRLATSLRQASFDLRGGDLSTLSPAEKLQQQRGEFARLAGLSAGGDKDALGRLPEAARSFLDASRDFNATTEAYARDFAAVQIALDRAAEQAGDLALAANYQAELVDLQEQVLAAIQDTLGQARIDSGLLQRQAQALEAIEATLLGTRRVTTQALGEAVDQSAIQDVLKGLTGEQKAAVEGVLSQVSQGTSLQGTSIGKLTELVAAVRDQQEEEARRRADEERRRAEEEARQAALRAQRQAAVTAARASTGNINLPSNVGEGGITVSNAGGRFFLSLLNSGLAGDYMRTVVGQLNSLIDSLGVTLQPFNPLTWTNTTINPQSLFNQLLAFLGLSGFAAGGIMTPRGPLDLRRYAGGGIADRPQLALFGEGRANEAFVPLPDGRSIPVTLRLAGNDNAAVVAALARHGTAIVAEMERGFALLDERLERVERELGQAVRARKLAV